MRAALDAAGCALDRIAKPVILAGADTGGFFPVLTAGGNSVDKAAAAAAMVTEAIRVPGGSEVRAGTGFAFGGVSPVGHMTPIRAFADLRLLDFPLVWADAGTPRHVIAIDPKDLVRAIGADVALFIG